MANILVTPQSTIEGFYDTNNIIFTVSLQQTADDDVTVYYRILNGTATTDTLDTRAQWSDDYTITIARGTSDATITVPINGEDVDEYDEALVLEVFRVEGADLPGGEPTYRTTAWILDDDGTGSNLALFVSNPVVIEGDGGARSARFDIELSRDAPENITINYATRDGSAVAGEDYTDTSGALTFSTGQRTKSVFVPILGDIIPDPTEFFTLDVAAPSVVKNVSDGIAEIRDDDPSGGAALPVVNVTTLPMIEQFYDYSNLTIELTLTEPSDDEVTVHYRLRSATATTDTIDLTAQWDNDYTVTFARGETSKTIRPEINGEALDEYDEALIFEVFSVDNAVLAGNQPISRSISWIRDDDGTGRNIAIMAGSPVIEEGDGGTQLARFEISLSRPAPEAFSVAYATRDISALAGSDYVAKSGAVQFAEGQTTATVFVEIIGDRAPEATEFFALDITAPTWIDAVTDGTAQVSDNDNAGAANVPVLNISAQGQWEQFYDYSNLTYTLTLTEPSDDVITVHYRYRNGSANTDTLDMTAQLDGDYTLIFQRGETSKTLRPVINGDNVDELDEALVLEVFQIDGAELAGGAQIARTAAWIWDEDGTGRDATIFTSSPVIVEGDSGQKLARFDISASRVFSETYEISYTTIDGSARAGEDYTAVSGSVTMPIGQSELSVFVPILGDSVAEPTEMFTLDVSASGIIKAVTDGVGEIHDDDTASGASVPVVNLSAESQHEQFYDYSNLTFTLTLSEASDSDVTIFYRLRNGTATTDTFDTTAQWDSDYSVTIPRGSLSATVRPVINGDNLDEIDEALVFEVYAATNAELAGGGPVLHNTAWILDDDGTGVNIALFASDALVLEGASGETMARFEISLSRPAPEAFDVSYATIDGSALAGTDYVATSGTISFAEGQTTAYVDVPVYGDTVPEATEVFTLDLTAPAWIKDTHDGLGEILDDDAGAARGIPTANVSAENQYEGFYDYSNLTYTVTLSEATDDVVTVHYRLRSGTAQTEQIDTTARWTDDATLVFQRGETSKTIRPLINGENVDEYDEALVLEVFSADGAVLAGGADRIRSTAWILDDDGSGENLAMFTSSPVMVEGDSGAREAVFEISLSRPAPEAFTVRYETQDGSASYLSDYAARSGTLSFAVGQTVAYVAVPVYGDGNIEPNETFTLLIEPSLTLVKEVTSGVATLLADGDDGLTGGFDDWLGEPDFGEAVTYNGGNGNDLLVGGVRADRLYGGAGNDTLRGSLGNDALDGGSGTDMASYIFSPSAIRGDLRSQVVRGGEGSDLLTSVEGIEGSDGYDDLLWGMSSGSTLSGLGGNDSLYGDAGDDLLMGGTGNDRVYGRRGSDDLYGDIGDDILLAGDGDDMIDAGDGNDRVYGGGAGDDLLYGGAGEDRFYGSAGGSLGTAYGGDGLDRFYKNSALTFYGGAGEDYLFGGTLDEVAYGGTARDVLKGQEGSDQLYGDAGIDRLYGADGSDTLFGGDDVDRLYGGDAEDTIYGGDRNDHLIGGGGDDLLVGGLWNDRLYGDAGNDVIHADGDGATSIGAWHDTIYAGSGNDSIYAGDGDDYIFSGAGNDLIEGAGGFDRIYAGAGSDDIDAGGGLAYVYGGTEGDTFRISTLEAGEMLIYDFVSGEDLLDFVDVTRAGGGTVATGLDADTNSDGMIDASDNGWSMLDGRHLVFDGDGFDLTLRDIASIAVDDIA